MPGAGTGNEEKSPTDTAEGTAGSLLELTDAYMKQMFGQQRDNCNCRDTAS